MAVGFATVTNDVENKVLADIDGATVTAAGNAALSATETANLTAFSLGGAVSIAGGAGAGLAGAGAGGNSTNIVKDTVEAYLANGASVTTTAGGNVTLTATDTPTANAQTVAPPCRSRPAPRAPALSIGAGIANNTIADTVHATSDGATIQAAGGVALTATETPTATAMSIAASVSLAIAPTSFSFAGGGASSTNSIHDDVQAYIQGAGSASKSTVTAGGDVTVSATETGWVDAEVGSVSIAGGVAGASVGVSLSTNTDDSPIQAGIDNATVTGRNIQVGATAHDTVTTHTLATSIAVSLGGAGAGGDASATVSPTVQAYAGGGATLTATGDLAIASNTNSTATASNTGVAGSTILAVGISTAEATVGGSTTSTVGAGATLTAGGSLGVTATATESTDAEASAFAGALIAGGDATATATTTQAVKAVVGDETAASPAPTTLSAGTGATISSSDTTTKALAMTTNKIGGAVAVGNPTSTTTLNDSSHAALGGNVTVTVALGDFTLKAVSENDGVKSDAEAAGGGIVKFASGTATTNLTSPATAVVGAGSSVSALQGSLLVQSQTGTDANAVATADGGGLGVNSTTEADTTVSSTAESDVKQGASLTARFVTVTAQGGTSRKAQANATSSSSALGVTTKATTKLSPTYTSTVSVAGGTSLTGTDLVQLSADSGAITADSVATGNSSALGGETDANASDTMTYGASVSTAAGSTIVAGSLTVSANTPTPTVKTDDPRTTAAIETGSGSKPQTLTPQNTVQFNSDVTLLGAGPRLHIGPGGQVIEQSGGVTFQSTPTQISVDNITNQSTGSATFTTSGQGTRQISGNAAFHFGTSLAAVIITNDSPKSLVMHDVQVINPDPTSNVQIDPTVSQNFHYTTDIAAATRTTVDIRNTSSSDIILAGQILNPLGDTLINNADPSTNTGGSVLSNGTGQLIQTNTLTLSSKTGALGTSANRLNAQLVQNSGQAPNVQESAAGNVYLDLSGRNQTSDPFAVAGSVTGGVVDLRIEDGSQLVAGTTTAQDGSYTFNNVSASRLNADAGSTTAVALSFAATGDLNVGVVTSRKGDVSLSAGGSIVAASGGAGTNVNANNITLTAGKAIGTAGHFLTVNSARNGTGMVNATAVQDIHLKETAGDLNLGQVISTTGDVSLESAGRILDAGGAGTVAVAGGNAVLTASQGIGTASVPIQTNVQDLEADSGTGGLWLSNAGSLTVGGGGSIKGLHAAGMISVSSAGAMTVAEDVASNADITLTTAADFLLNGGVTVQSTAGAVTIAAAGNVTLPAQSTVAAAKTVTIDGDLTGASGGSTIDLSGRLRATSAQITTGSADDAVFVHQLPYNTPLSVDTGAGNDLLQIDGTAGNNTFTVTATQVAVQTPQGSAQINYAHVESLTIDSKPTAHLGGNDTFTVNGTSASLLTTIETGDGNDALVVNASVQTGATVQNTPLLFVGGAGINTVQVNGTGTGDQIVLANEALAEHGADVVGAGLQLQYEDASQLTLNTLGGNSTVYVLGTRVPTTIQTGAGNNTVDLGGNLATNPTITVPAAGGSQSFTAPETLDGFEQTLTFQGGAGTNALNVDDRNDQSARYPVLDTNTLLGLGETQPQPGVPSLMFTGVTGMTVSLGSGGGQFTVNNTFTASSPNAFTLNTGTGDENVTVFAASVPLVLHGGSGQNEVHFDGSELTTAILGAVLGQGPTAAQAHLTGFGPIGDVLFDGFAQADLDLGMRQRRARPEPRRDRHDGQRLHQRRRRHDHDRPDRRPHAHHRRHRPGHRPCQRAGSADRPEARHASEAPTGRHHAPDRR